MSLAQRRLATQGIAGARFTRPVDVVKWLGAVQAQDYLGALWAVGLRMQRATEGAVEQALANRSIVRTWPMRGTLHFVAAADARWITQLLGPRIVARHAPRLKRDYGLDDAVYAKARNVVEKALRDGPVTRDALYQSIESAGLDTDDQRGLHIVWRLAHEGLVCFGAREGKQQTFVLLDDWIPESRRLARDEALAELASRYFAGHGPATLRDFAWWSGLKVADAKAGLASAAPSLAQETIEGRVYWFGPDTPDAVASSGAHLLPVYDEYLVAYRDRSAALEAPHAAGAGNAIFTPTIVMHGKVVGTWRRTRTESQVVIAPAPFRPLKKGEKEAMAAPVRRYGVFLGVPAVMAW